MATATLCWQEGSWQAVSTEARLVSRAFEAVWCWACRSAVQRLWLERHKKWLTACPEGAESGLSPLTP